MIFFSVVICLKISTFVVSTTTFAQKLYWHTQLWFAWKYLPLWYQQQPDETRISRRKSCDLLENIYLCGINNNVLRKANLCGFVVICLKISTFVVSTTTLSSPLPPPLSCDLLENIYLCGINNNALLIRSLMLSVVICLKISTFVVSTTTGTKERSTQRMLWFAWKYLPLWYQQQPRHLNHLTNLRCDLLENIYLCGINNNSLATKEPSGTVVICLKISTFVVSTTTFLLLY